MDATFALGYFQHYLALLDDIDAEQPSRDRELIAADMLRAQPTLRRLLEECGERVRNTGKTPGGRQEHREAVLRAEGVLRDRDAVERAFAPPGPQVQAEGLHPWVWEPAAELWPGKHYRQAVAAAAGNVSLQVQVKLDRWDVADDALMTAALSEKPPTQSQPRLRVPATPGRPFEEALQQGTLFYARGVWSLLRNPATHNVAEVWSEQRGFEALAALSVLARLLDSAAVERADTDG
ncbi:TIGR02391 family protein [Geodermatophilus sp. SYSU D00700]